MAENLPAHRALADGCTYAWFTYSEMESDLLYKLLQVRQAVFIVEQNCPYLDADGLDRDSHHLLCRIDTAAGKEIAGCLRVIEPGRKHEGPTMGRLLTVESLRGRGIARELTSRAIRYCSERWPGQPLTLSAQLYLQAFYESFGFAAISGPYSEDGIPHIAMRINSDRAS